MLIPIAANLWGAESSAVFGGVLSMPIRMTVIRLLDGALVLHSPIPVDDALAAELAALGVVRYLVAPNRLHHLYVADVHARYPAAELWGAPGLAEKRPDLRFHGRLCATPPDVPAPPAWAPELEPRLVDGNALTREVVFLHRPTRTLLVTDLVFNMRALESRVSAWILWSVGAYGRLAQSLVWRLSTRDRAAARASIEAILAWDFDRLVMAHGTVLETEAKAELERILAWMR